MGRTAGLCIGALVLLSARAAAEPARASCAWAAAERGGERIIDISMGLHAGSVVMGSDAGLGGVRSLRQAKARGDICNESMLDGFCAHTGTHVDASSHFVEAALQAGRGVESLDLSALTGPALVLEVPADQNITAAALEALRIPAGTERVIFKTLNTQRGLMTQTAFDSSYTAMSADGAEWLVRHTGVRLVGIDALSIAAFADLVGPHDVLLGQGVIPVEGLVLGGVAPGLYTLICLPLKLVGSDGAPARCILMP